MRIPIPRSSEMYPRLTEEEREKLKGKILAISLETNTVIDHDITRISLRLKLLPLVCGKDYYEFMVR